MLKYFFIDNLYEILFLSIGFMNLCITTILTLLYYCSIYPPKLFWEENKTNKYKLLIFGVMYLMIPFAFSIGSRYITTGILKLGLYLYL